MVVAISPDEALEHPSRKALHAAVAASPGIGFRALVRQVGIPLGTARHHLNVLLRCGLLREERVGPQGLAFLPAHDARSAVAVAALREPGMMQLRDAVAGKGRVCQRDLVAALPWPRSTTQNRLDRLVEAGVLRLTIQGRYRFYEVAA